MNDEKDNDSRKEVIENLALLIILYSQIVAELKRSLWIFLEVKGLDKSKRLSEKIVSELGDFECLEVFRSIADRYYSDEDKKILKNILGEIHRDD